MENIQCNVEDRYKLCICSRTEERKTENFDRGWSAAGPSNCIWTSSQQSGVEAREIMRQSLCVQCTKKQKIEGTVLFNAPRLPQEL
jgi:hypothetical protein